MQTETIAPPPPKTTAELAEQIKALNAQTLRTIASIREARALLLEREEIAAIDAEEAIPTCRDCCMPINFRTGWVMTHICERCYYQNGGRS